MNRLTAELHRRNQSRDNQWRVSAHHRRNVTERIMALAGTGGRRLCILGAGNGNDLELPTLAAAFREIHLVDIDGEALARGVARQFSGDAPVHLSSLDVTGVWDSLDALALGSPPSDEGLDELIRAAADPAPLPLGGPFDITVSVGLISQLIDGVVRAVPDTFPRFMELLLGVRTGHLRLLARLTAPGGHGLLITDYVSSATVPQLATMDDGQLGGLAEHLAAKGNFFHGLNPLFLPKLFENDPTLQSLIASVKHCGHWIWDQKSRLYAVMAIEFERSLTNLTATP
jgi:hypothetical protein